MDTRDQHRPQLPRPWAAVAVVGLACLGTMAWPAPLPGQEPSQGPAEAPATPEEPAGAPATGEPAETENASATGGKVVYGKIDSEIGLAESAYVKRLIEAAEDADAEVLALELNTFGGRVDAAVAIRDALLDAPVHTVVFINKRAISAGALISLACKSIAISAGGTIGAATPIVQSPGQEMPEAVEEKYLSYFRQEMRVTAEANHRNGDIAEAMVDKDKEIPDVIAEGKLLTLTTTTALEYKIADLEATSMEDALEQLDLLGPMQTVERSWAENVVAFITSQAISSLLFLAMLVLGYMEFKTPGIGLFGLGAVICFLLLYFGHYMVNLAGFEELILFLLGVGLILVELLVIPGFGVVGILGFLLVLISLILLLMAGDWSTFSFDNPLTADALFQVAIALALSVVVMGIVIRFLPRHEDSLFGGRLILAQGLKTGEGFLSHQTPRVREEDLTGQTGTAITPLRPSGKARIGNRRLNVETEGDFIDKDQSLRVVRHEPGLIIVRRAREEEAGE